MGHVKTCLQAYADSEGPDNCASMQSNQGLCCLLINIGIKHGFSCINIRQVPWEVLKTEAEGKTFATFRIISCTILSRLFTDVSRT